MDLTGVEDVKKLASAYPIWLIGQTLAIVRASLPIVDVRILSGRRIQLFSIVWRMLLLHGSLLVIPTAENVLSLQKVLFIMHTSFSIKCRN